MGAGARTDLVGDPRWEVITLVIFFLGCLAGKYVSWRRPVEAPKKNAPEEDASGKKTAEEQLPV
jgi:hypothetical protein